MGSISSHGITPWSRVPHKKLTGVQVVRELPTLWNPKFHYMFKSANHLYPHGIVKRKPSDTAMNQTLVQPMDCHCTD
jgi:hypothetical protein